MRYGAPVLVCMLLLMATVFMSTAKNNKKAKPPSRMYFAAVIVKNIDTSSPWYAKMYDLKLKDRTDNEQRGYKQLNLVNDDLWIELVELKDGVDKSVLLTGEHAKSGIHGISKIGFISDDIDAAHAELKGKGAKFMGRNEGFFVTDQVTKRRGFVIADPDGNFIQYFENK